jgi:hypothetical protein
MMTQDRDSVHRLPPSPRQKLDAATTALLRAYTVALAEMRPQDAHRFIHRLSRLMTQVEVAAGMPSGRISRTSEWRATLLRSLLRGNITLDSEG